VSCEAVRDKLASPAHEKEVTSWLEAAGVPAAALSWSRTRDFVSVNVPTDAAADNLQSTRPTAVEYMHVVPAGTPPMARSMRRHTVAGPGANPQVTPQEVRERLDMINVTTPAHVGIASPYDEPLDVSSFDAMVSKYGLHGSGSLDTSNASRCIGGGTGGGEPALDVSVAIGTNPNSTVHYYCGPKGHSGFFCEALLDYLVWVYDTPDAPLVHSFSYGAPKHAACCVHAPRDC